MNLCDKSLHFATAHPLHQKCSGPAAVSMHARQRRSRSYIHVHQRRCRSLMMCIAHQRRCRSSRMQSSSAALPLTACALSSAALPLFKCIVCNCSAVSVCTWQSCHQPVAILSAAFALRIYIGFGLYIMAAAIINRAKAAIALLEQVQGTPSFDNTLRKQVGFLKNMVTTTQMTPAAVSYTHLTLPTIYSV